MRISPVVFYILNHPGPDAFENDEAFDIVHKVSVLTHAHKRRLIGCDIYAAMLLEILKGTRKDMLCPNILPKMGSYARRHPEFQNELNKYWRISRVNFTDLPEKCFSTVRNHQLIDEIIEKKCAESWGKRKELQTYFAG